MKEFSYKDTTDEVDWSRVRKLLSDVGMSYSDEETHKTSFENSYSVLFVYDEEYLIGMGRLLSDGVRQSAIYDLAVDPKYQGHRLGSNILSQLMAATPQCNFMLYASPGKEAFYNKMGFKQMKTGMLLFADASKMIDSPFLFDEE